MNEQLQLTMYMTPHGGNNIHKVNFHVYNMGDVHIWNREDVESMPHFGSGAIVTRDFDEQTGTRFWDGWLIDGNEYLIRIRNSSDEDIHYWLFTDDIWDVNLSVKPCNSNSTTPVTAYEGKGDSPFGVVDMAGNVWEWCVTEYESGSNSLSGTNVRLLHGGSWGYGGTDFFRVSVRFRLFPGYGDFNRGFRLALSS